MGAWIDKRIGSRVAQGVFRAAIGATVLSVAACSSANVLRLQQGAEVADIYKQGTAETVASEAEREQLIGELRRHNVGGERVLPRYEAWSRSALNEINQLFPVLDNPTITMYVYPHLAAREQVPVPGYTTAFRLYESDQYALPHELPANYPADAYRRAVPVDVLP